MKGKEKAGDISIGDLPHIIEFDPVKFLAIIEDSDKLLEVDPELTDLESTDMAKFIQAYINLVRLNAKLHQAKLAELRAALLYHVSQVKKSEDSCKIIKLILSYPEMDLSCAPEQTNLPRTNKPRVEDAFGNRFRFLLDSNPLNSTAFQQLFSLYQNEKDLTLKEEVGELIAYELATNPDASAVRKPGYYDKHLIVSYVAAAALIQIYSLRKLGFWKHLIFSPAIKLVSLSFTVLAGWHVMNHILTTYGQSHNATRLAIDDRKLIGSFTTTQFDFLGVDTELTTRLDANLTPAQNPSNYQENYHARKDLLRKYAKLEALIENDKSNWFNGKKYHKLKLQLQSEYKKLNLLGSRLPDGSKLIFEAEIEVSLPVVAGKTFNTENFSNITKNLTPEHKTEVMKLYDLVDKGFLALDLETVYILSEMVNHITYPNYQSPIKKVSAENSSNSLETFFYAFNYATQFNSEGVEFKDFLRSLENFNGDIVTFAKTTEIKVNEIPPVPTKVTKALKSKKLGSTQSRGEGASDTHKNGKGLFDTLINGWNSAKNEVTGAVDLKKQGADVIEKITSNEQFMQIARVGGAIVLGGLMHLAISSSLLRIPTVAVLATACFYREGVVSCAKITSGASSARQSVKDRWAGFCEDYKKYERKEDISK